MTHSFASQFKEQSPLHEDEGYVTYDVDSLFNNIPLQEIIDLFIQQVSTENILLQIFSKTLLEDY